MRSTCGYTHPHGKWCGSKPVHFICRYKRGDDMATDYCVMGIRVTRYDSGRITGPFGDEPTTDQVRLLGENDANEAREFEQWKRENAHLFA